MHQGARAGGADEGRGDKGRPKFGGRDKEAPGGLPQVGKGPKPGDRTAVQQVSLLVAQNNNHNQSQSKTQLVYLSQQPMCLFVCVHVHRVQQLEDENDEMKLNVCRLKSQTEKLDQVMFYLFIYNYCISNWTLF